jgi:hypothetical protein
MVLVVCFAEPARDVLEHAGEEAHAFGLALGIMISAMYPDRQCMTYCLQMQSYTLGG